MIIILFIDASRGLSHGKSVRPIYLGQPAIVILSDRPGSEVSRPRVVFSIEGVGDAAGEFHRFASPRTADALLRSLPIGGSSLPVREGDRFYAFGKGGREESTRRVADWWIAYLRVCLVVCAFFGARQTPP